MRVHFTSLIAAAIGMASGAACEKTTTEHRLEGPMRLELGDCAEISTKYVSGHKPEPFQLSELKSGKVGSPYRSFGTSGASADTAPDKRPDQTDGADEPGESSGPSLTVGEGAARGKLDEEAIRAPIENESETFLRCYQAALAEEPELAGTVVVSFTIGKRGKVAEVVAVGISDDVAACVTKTFKALRFPRPEKGEVKARYPLKFKPGAASRRSEERAPDKPERPSPTAKAAASDDGSATGTGVAEAAAAGAAEARASARAVLDNPPGYQPGVGNPLREYRQPLLECFRTKVPKKRPYGSVVVDLVKYQGAHAVVEVASDTGNDTLEECVRDAIGAASEAVAKAAPVERCPLAFGSTPLDQAEGIDITDDRVLAGRRMRAMVADITADTGDNRSLERLQSWAEKLVKKRSRLSHKSLANDQPVVLRPLGSTPVGVVRRVLEATSAAGLDTVLAVYRGDAWQPVHGFALPSTPVPRDSGQGFSIDRHAGKHREGGRPTVFASLLVGTDDVWIGVSRIDDFRQFSARGQKLDLDVFRRGLKDVKLMSHFADRRDIEIAAVDEVTYDTLVTFIDHAIAAGFTEWTLMAPDQLSARPPDFR